MSISWEQVLLTKKGEERETKPKEQNKKKTSESESSIFSSILSFFVSPSTNDDNDNDDDDDDDDDVKRQDFCEAIEWIEEYTRFSVKSSTEYVIVSGGTEQEWKEIAKLSCFSEIQITPDMLFNVVY